MRSHRLGQTLRALWQAISRSIPTCLFASGRSGQRSAFAIITFSVIGLALGLNLPLVRESRLIKLLMPATAAARDITAAQIAVVSAASYETTVAPDSIVAIFGANLATQTVVAGDADPNTPGIQLPTQLGGTTVEVNGQRAPLFFVSPAQVNVLLPKTTALGTADVIVRSSNGTTNSGTAQIVQSDPGLFSIFGTGSGIAAANLLRVKANGTQIYEDVFKFDNTNSRLVFRPIDLGPVGEQVFLVLYGTALRLTNNPDGRNSNVAPDMRVLIGNEERTPSFAGANPGLIGVDQINVALPRTLIGRGIVNVSVAALGFSASNLVEIEIAGAAGATPPQNLSFDTTDVVLAGTQVNITGSGFVTTNPEDNAVSFTGGAKAKVMTAEANKLKVVVPYGAETGQVSVTTPQGTGRSNSDLRVKTSISGIVEDTNKQPLSNVLVRIDGNGPLVGVYTTDQGAFVLPIPPEIPIGPLTLRIDGGQLPVDPPYPPIVRRQPRVRANKDNPFEGGPISLQQSSGASGTIGGGSAFTEDNNTPSALRSLNLATEPVVRQLQQQLAQQLPQQTGVTLQNGSLILAFPSNLTAVFPATKTGTAGATSGTVYLTSIPKGRTPIPMPNRVYSESIAQITPFGVQLTPGAKLTFANTENHQPGAKLALYRYDYAKGVFGEVEGATLTVTPDRSKIETGATDIKDSSIYLVGVPSSTTTAITTTTVRGRVLCCELPDGTVKDAKPVARATVRVRGQAEVTDGSGGFIVRNVAASAGERVRVDVSNLRADGRTDIAESKEVIAKIGDITNAEDIVLPSDAINRPPIILAANRAVVDAGKSINLAIQVYDPDTGQKANASIRGPEWAFLCKSCRDISQTLGPNEYRLTLTPPPNERSGEARFTITATDAQSKDPATTEFTITVVVNNPNRPPTADEQEVETDEDKSVTIKLTGSDPDAGSKLSYEITRQPNSGTLSAGVPSVTYTPRANFNGNDSFSFRVSDGTTFSLPATVKITVKAVNDSPVLTVPPTATVAEGQPLTLNLSAADVDTGQTLAFTSSNMPTGASLTPTSATTAQFRWTPNFTQAGSYTVSFKVTDNGSPALSDSKDTRITVTDTTTLSVPAAQAAIEGQTIAFDVATSLALPDVNITAANLPAGAAFTARGGGVWQFRWTPASDQAGVYTVSFQLSTGGGVVESRDVKLIITDVFRDFGKEPANLVVYGAHGLLPLSSTDAGDAAGTSIVTGDVNGDGVSDLIIGAPNANSDLTDAGKVYVFFGKASLAGTVDLAQQRPDLTIIGEKAYDGFGSSIAVGDVTGDNQADLLIGAPLADHLDRKDGGKLYVIQAPLKAEGPTEGQIVNRLASFTVLGAKGGDQLGASLAIGALNEKTGALDFVTGAPGYDAREGIDAGAVYGFWGGDKLSGVLDLAQGVPSFALTGVIAGGQAGKTLAVGNFNGDDVADLAIGAPSANVGTTRANGMVYLVQSTLTLNRVKTLTEEVPLPLAGDRDGDVLGTSLAFGDYDGDGLADLVMGVPGADGPDGLRRNSGKVMILFGARAGSTTTRALTIFGPGSKDDLVPDEFGTSVTLGDFNGDGLADLLAGAPGYDTVADRRDPLGAAFLLFGTRSSLSTTIDLSSRAADLTVIGLDPGDRLGLGALAIGNVNGGTGTNSINDLIFGFPRAYSLNNARGEAGEVRVIFGVPR